MEELRLERERAALKVRLANAGRLDDEDRWRIAEELGERAIPRRHWSPR
jgi:hypothetical protein